MKPMSERREREREREMREESRDERKREEREKKEERTGRREERFGQYPGNPSVCILAMFVSKLQRTNVNVLSKLL